MRLGHFRLCGPEMQHLWDCGWGPMEKSPLKEATFELSRNAGLGRAQWWQGRGWAWVAGGAFQRTWTQT